MVAARYLVLATGNAGKVKEFEALLGPGGFSLLTPKDIGFTGEVDETGITFRDNALIKARALSARTPYPVLADDSGLEVDALGGAPGVRSARYCVPGEAAPGLSQDAANRAKLLRALAAHPSPEDRRARFRCTLCYLVPGREPLFFDGVCEGTIAPAERGGHGFGYDPLFIPEGHDRTFGELPAEMKDPMSHRGQAAARFLLSFNG
jgi:XTP/dITP diphosphohydrolase